MLFSALERTQVLACDSAGVTSFFIVHFVISTKQSGLLTALTVIWLMPHETAAIWCVQCTPFIQPCTMTMSCRFKQSCICKVHACLAVTFHLHFCRMTRKDLLYEPVTKGRDLKWDTASKYRLEYQGQTDVI